MSGLRGPDRRRVRGAINFIVLLSELLFAAVVVLMLFVTGVSWSGDDDPPPADPKVHVAYDRDCGSLDWQQAFRLKFAAPDVVLNLKSRSYWNASGLILEAGVVYVFSVAADDRWRDWWVPAGVNGWLDDDGQPLPPQGLTARLAALKRAPFEPYFQLMGATFNRCANGMACSYVFPMNFAPGADGRLTFEFESQNEGEFCSFANDWPFMYWNNFGTIELTIHRKRLP